MAEPKKLQYQEVLEKFDIKQEALPIEIRNKIKALAPLIGRFNNAVKDGKPSEALNDAIIKQDIEIADMITDFDEKDLPDEAELLAQKEEAERLKAEKEKAGSAESKAAAQKVIDDAAAAKATSDAAKAKADAEQAAANANAAKEAEIKQVLSTKSDKRIATSELAKILGSAPVNPTVVGATKLRQVPFNSEYFELVS